MKSIILTLFILSSYPCFAKSGGHGGHGHSVSHSSKSSKTHLNSAQKQRIQHTKETIRKALSFFKSSHSGKQATKNLYNRMPGN